MKKEKLDAEPYTKLMNDGIKNGLKVEHLDWVWNWYKENFYLNGRFRPQLLERQVLVDKNKRNSNHLPN